MDLISRLVTCKTYHSFSKISGIELNTAKTEILRIGDEHIEKNYIIVDVDSVLPKKQQNAHLQSQS